MFDKLIVTSVTRFETFSLAEAYHQDYFKKNTIQYKYYRLGSGRDQFLERAWKDRPMDETLV